MKLAMARIGFFAMIVSFSTCGYALGGLFWSAVAMFFIGALLYGGALAMKLLEKDEFFVPSDIRPLR